MSKVAPIAVVVLLAVIALSAYAYTVYLPSISVSPSGAPGGSSSSNPAGNPGGGAAGGVASAGTGTLNIYLTDAPPSSPTLKYLLINVSSVALRYEGNISKTPPMNQFVFVVPKATGTNVNLTKLHGQSVLLGATKIPAGNCTGIILDITGAKAFWTNGNSTQLKVVADGKLMIPVHFSVGNKSNTNLTIDVVPNDIHISAGQASVLTPVIHVNVVTSDEKGTKTVTTETSVSSSTTTTTTTSRA